MKYFGKTVALLLATLTVTALSACNNTEKGGANTNNDAFGNNNTDILLGDDKTDSETTKNDTSSTADLVKTNGEESQENADETANADTEIEENDPEAQEEIPTTGDTYYYEPESYGDFGFEIVGELESSRYAIYTVDGEHYGICDMNGEVSVEPIYTTLGWCPVHKVVYAEPFPEGTEPVVISDEYRIDLHYGHGGQGEAYYIYDENARRMFIASADIECFYVSETDTLPTEKPYICYVGDTPIAEGEYYPGSEGEELFTLISELAFEQAEYEFVTGKGSIVSLGSCERVDDFVNGYAVVKRSGKLGFVDSLGNEACEFVYTDAMRAYDSKAWVKCEDGAWRVVNLSAS